MEIFAEQKDFGVRTFGMPDNPGFLGVCFGCVITANSPASQMPRQPMGERSLARILPHGYAGTYPQQNAALAQ